jgi:CDP-diacylglycerol--inositol 3-phosphatidyltransferase
MVFLFVPNLIGYLRFVFLFAVFPLYRNRPLLALICYGLSQVLDAFDGMAARYFKQSTRFGAVLDMVCDRASNGVMLAILAGLYPEWSWVFLGDIVLDLVSHWYQMYVSLLRGQHHKESQSSWKLLNLYYGNKKVLFTLVAGNEIFLIAAFIHANRQLLGLCQNCEYLNLAALAIGLVLFLVKKLMSVIQLISASQKLAELDIADRLQKQN